MVQRISGTPGTLGEQPESTLAATAGETTAQNPWPLALLSTNIKRYIERMSTVWVEGQVIELNHRGQASYLTLRDLNEEMSLPVQVFKNVLDRLDAPLNKGSHVVVQLTANFWLKTGRFSMRATDIRTVGLGELLARLERLKKALAVEGLFDPAHKKPLPFLPNTIGLITGRDSDAQKDVLENAALRWPAVKFRVINTRVQGTSAVPEVMAALAELDADPEVDVIVIARGGGSLEDLLPFSNETLVRAVYAAHTPVVSAIGHENDRPILDEVADLRASTPTDAAKRIVPDFHEETMQILQARATLENSLMRFLDREMTSLADLRSRPVLANPLVMVADRQVDIANWRQRALSFITSAVDKSQSQIEHLRNQVRALSPLNTLARGYAIVQDGQGQAVHSAAEVSPGQTVNVTVERGSFTAQVLETTADPDHSDADSGGTEPTSEGAHS